MADTIDPNLRQEAVQQIFNHLQREGDPSPTVQAMVKKDREDTAAQMFSDAWYGARRMQVGYLKHKATLPKPFTPPALDEKELANLSPERQEAKRRIHALKVKAFTPREDLSAVRDEAQRKVLIKTFTDSHVTEATANKLAALVIEMTK